MSQKELNAEEARQREIEQKRKPLDIGDNDKEILQKYREEKYGG